VERLGADDPLCRQLERARMEDERLRLRSTEAAV
jgi:hypothetical protein